MPEFCVECHHAEWHHEVDGPCNVQVHRHARVARSGKRWITEPCDCAGFVREEV